MAAAIGIFTWTTIISCRFVCRESHKVFSKTWSRNKTINRAVTSSRKFTQINQPQDFVNVCRQMVQ